MKKILLFAGLWAFACMALAQDVNPQKTIGIRAYSNFSYLGGTYSYGDFDMRIRDFRHHPSLALFWKGERAMTYEVELNEFSSHYREWTRYGDPVLTNPYTPGVPAVNSSFGFGSRFEMIYPFWRNSERPLKFSTGLGFNFSYGMVSAKSYDTEEFKLTDHVFNLGAFLTPRLTYWFKPRWCFDVNLPIPISNLELNHYRNTDPTNAIPDRNSTYFEYTIFSWEKSIRLGVGVVL